MACPGRSEHRSWEDPRDEDEPVCDKASPDLSVVENANKLIIISYLEDTFPHTLAVPSTKPTSRAERFRNCVRGRGRWADVNSTK